MKFGLILLLALVSLSTGFAREQGLSIEERIALVEQQRGYFRGKNQYRVVAEGDLLYWKADVDGVAYDTTSVAVPVNIGFGTINTNLKTRTPHFSYDPGFRLIFGVQSGFDLFDLRLQWTRFYTKGHDEAHGTFVPALINPNDKIISLGIGLIQELTSIPNSTHVTCGIKVNILDLQLARGIEISRHFFMRPYFGIRGVWCDIHWNIAINRTFASPGIFNQDSTFEKIKNDFHAAGGLIGLVLDWEMPYGFGINARAAGALVYGLSEEKTKQSYTLLPSFGSTSSEQNLHARNSFHTVKGMLEMFAGVFWESEKFKHKGKDRKEQPYLRLFIGYEFQEWPLFGQKTNTQTTRERDRFSVGFQGLTGGARVVL